MQTLCRVVVLLLVLPVAGFAVTLGNIRGVVHDPQHRGIAHARATLEAKNSQFRQPADTNADGLFEFSAVPPGEYTVTVEAPGFATQAQRLIVTSGSAPVLHYPLSVAAVQSNVTVSATSAEMDTLSSTKTTLISREQIARYAGVDNANSLRMVTEFVPGAYIVHDQLHVRGGHQVTFAIDGVPLPNTNIASSVGPQISPKDVDYLEAQTGGYAPDYGDRKCNFECRATHWV